MQAISDEIIRELMAFLERGSQNEQTDDPDVKYPLERFKNILGPEKLDLSRTAPLGFKWDITVMHLAASHGAKKIVQFLLRYQPSLAETADAKGRMPLYYAVVMSQLDVARLLLEKNPNVNAEDSDEITVLDELMLEHNYAAVRLSAIFNKMLGEGDLSNSLSLVIDHGADLSRNYNGRSFLRAFLDLEFTRIHQEESGKSERSIFSLLFSKKPKSYDFSYLEYVLNSAMRSTTFTVSQDDLDFVNQSILQGTDIARRIAEHFHHSQQEVNEEQQASRRP